MKLLLALSLLSTSLMAQVAVNPSTHETTSGVAQNNVRQLQSNEHFLNLPGATTVDAPPEGFDPITASVEELSYYGFPPRPDQNANPVKFKSWAKAMKAAQVHVVPTLKQMNRFHGPVQKASFTQSSNWGGYVYTNTGTSSFTSVDSHMIVPHAVDDNCGNF